MNISDAIAGLAVVAGAFTFAETRYAPAAQVEDLVWAGMRREIRELRGEVERGEAPRIELDELVARFCREFPSDRMCQ